MKPIPISQTGKLRHGTDNFLVFAQLCSRHRSTPKPPAPLTVWFSVGKDPHRPHTHLLVACFGAQNEPRKELLQKVSAYVVMAQHHAFGGPCGPRGVDDDSTLVGLLAQDDPIQMYIWDAIAQFHEVRPLQMGRWVAGGDRAGSCSDCSLAHSDSSGLTPRQVASKGWQKDQGRGELSDMPCSWPASDHCLCTDGSVRSDRPCL